MRAFGCFIHVASDLSSASVLAVSLALVLVSSPCHALGAADSAPPLPGSIRTDAASITYFARAGDTLTSIARQFTDKSSNWIALGKLNRIDRQSAIPIGTTILIPGELLGDTPSKATVVAMTGSITAHTADGARTRLSVGATVLEGTQIDTGANSFLTLALPDESRISVPSNTSVRLAKLRSSRYLNSPRTQVTLLRGRVESRVTPLEANRGRYEVQTPLSIAGVRGTHFRVGVIGDGRTARVATETLDGKVAVNTGSSTNTSDKLILTTGRGNITDAGTVGPARDLLPAPRLSGASAGGFAEFPANRINLVGLAGAAAYHLQIATDAKATDLVAETRSATTTLAIDGVAEGNYYARLSAIDRVGLEGLVNIEPIALRRPDKRSDAGDQAATAQRSGTAAVPFTPVAPALSSSDDQTIVLRWASVAGQSMRLQLARDGDFNYLLANRLSTTGEARLPRPPFGTYYARVEVLDASGNVLASSLAQPLIVTDAWVINDGNPIAVRQTRATPAR